MPLKVYDQVYQQLQLILGAQGVLQEFKTTTVNELKVVEEKSASFDFSIGTSNSQIFGPAKLVMKTSL